MRRIDREMDAAFAYSVADKCEYAVLGMTLPDMTPYCIPLTIVREGGLIYFHSAMQGQKTDALKKRPQVCLTCVGSTRIVQEKFTTEYESALLFGRAEEVLDRDEKIHALRLLCKRHTPDSLDTFDEAIRRSLHRTAVWKIHIEQVTGKRKQYDQNGMEMKCRRMK
ncbi:pyridoxamine 5'-phosphate oxidase family protein [Candidatus Soleaferrea massiliensis]|uniref:pyridoxamine 5'-phosphate oxidase family protein n=1 Tax=Candidatus Soleaferrea massiliensis TaxID=1470354 RepID=UPI000590CABC|nr:pyridoxamine 5'-phosphate oxidase family protein [Candidatus Soleaferrea massiliensis]